jgi:hypothetical protein
MPQTLKPSVCSTERLSLETLRLICGGVSNREIVRATREGWV